MKHTFKMHAHEEKTLKRIIAILILEGSNPETHEGSVIIAEI